MDRRFLALPQRSEWPALLLMSAVFSCFFYAVYWLADRYTGSLAVRHRIDFAFEQLIPFWPWTVLVYMTITPLLMLAPFVLRSRARMMPLFLALCAEVAVAGISFVLYPAELGYPPHTVTGWLAVPMAATKHVNLTYNLAPSLHVAFAVTAASVLGRHAPKVWRSGLWLWALAIVASTLLVHEHHVIDVVTGILLAATAVKLIHDPLAARAAGVQCAA